MKFFKCFEYKTLAQTVNSGTDYSQKYFRQTASLDMNGVTDLQPVGTLANPFAGNYEGDGFTISNATINGQTVDGNTVAGIFGVLTGKGSITNLIITNATVTATAGTGVWDQAFAGGLAAVVEDATVQDCSVINSKITAGGGSNTFSGAVIGYIQAVNGEVTTISNCASDSNDVIGGGYGGGFAGAFLSIDDTVGSININNCYVAKNNVKAQTYSQASIGAFLGGSQGGDLNLTNCFVYDCSTDITGSSVGKTGLFIGETDNGKVTATNSYYYDKNNLTAKAQTATSKTVEEMKSLASMLGETFSQGSDYPILLHPINIVVSIDSWTYGETAKEPTVTRNSSVAASYTYAVKGNSNFSATVPANAGDYTIKASVARTNLHKAGESTANFTIAKANATVATAPTAKTLTYNGQPQELITAGTTNSGTMVYALGDNATTSPANDKYNVAIPTGTDNKIYYVWYKVSGDVNHNDSAAASIEVTIKLESYTIIYDLDGGTNNANNPASYTMTSPDITLHAPTKTGYTFSKWTSGDTTVPSIPQGTSGNLTLKANWTANTYTVKFNSNGGTGSMSDQTFTYDEEGKLNDNKFTRTGYTFNNWKDNASNKTYNGGASVKNLSSTNGATITLYAQWKEDEKTSGSDPQQEQETTDPQTDPQQEQDNTDPQSDPQQGNTDPAQESDPQTDPAQESDPQQGTTDPQTEEPVEEKTESKTADATEVSTMDDKELEQTFENKTEITLTGNISNENLSSVIEKIASVTEVKTLDLSKLENVTEVKLPETVKVESLTVAGNSSIVTLDVSNTALTNLDASNCENLTSIDCSNCNIDSLSIGQSPNLLYIDCSHNHILALDINSSDLNLTNLNEVNCVSQDLGNWLSVSSFDFDDFVESPDLSVDVSTSNFVRVSATKLSNVSNLKAYNKNNNPIAIITSDDNGNIVFASVPFTMTYDYNIGFKNTLMDVTVYAADNELADIVSSSGGCGCNVMRNEELGIRNVLILLFFEFLLLKLKIKRS